MRVVAALLAISCATPAFAQEKSASEDQTIVVTGQSLVATQKELDACLARHCPPREDIAASLRHAENQFVAGDYHAARETLAASRTRNAKYAADYPVEVADLQRAYGRVINHDGEPARGRLAQIDAVFALKAGLGSDDDRVLAQRLLVGDEALRTGDIANADRVYRQVEQQARKRGSIAVAGHAMFRSAMLYGTLAAQYPQFVGDARQRIRRLEQTTEPELAEFRTAAKLLRARLEAARGDTAALNSVVAELRDARLDRPVLIADTPVKLDRPDGLTVNASTAGTNRPPEWIDVRYHIAPDGSVGDVETVRQSESLHGGWNKLVEAAVAKRRYAPMAVAADAPVLDRVERFSLIYDQAGRTGSRLTERTSFGRLTSIDLTPDPPAKTTPS